MIDSRTTSQLAEEAALDSAHCRAEESRQEEMEAHYLREARATADNGGFTPAPAEEAPDGYYESLEAIKEAQRNFQGPIDRTPVEGVPF